MKNLGFSLLLGLSSLSLFGCDILGALTDDGVMTGELIEVVSSDGNEPLCWTVAPIDSKEFGLYTVDMATGEVTEDMRFAHTNSQSLHTQGLGYDGGDELVMSAYNGNDSSWFLMDLATGDLTTEYTTGYASSVTHNGDQFMSYSSASALFSVILYDDFAAIAADEPSEYLEDVGRGSRIGYADDKIYNAWHSTDTIEVYSIDGEFVRTIELEKYNNWVWGVSIIGDKLHLIDDGRNDYGDKGVRLAQFDLETGDLLRHVFLKGDAFSRPSGLWCRAE